jgi:FtsP/CotA-like multicopper oxidase with cupredoxin domain
VRCHATNAARCSAAVDQAGTLSCLHLATDFRLRYHGHAGEQHADGLFGALVISSEEDDEAAGRATLTTASAADGGDEAAADDALEWVWVLSDMYDAPAATLSAAYLAPGGGVEPTPDAIAVNGVRADDAAALAGFNATARRGGADAAPVRLRLVNAATASTFVFSADATPLTLLELDGGGISAAMPPLRAITLVPGQRAAVLLNFPSVSAAAAVWARVEALASAYDGVYDADAPNEGLLGAGRGAPLVTRWATRIAFVGEGEGGGAQSSAALLPAGVPDADGVRPEDDANVLCAPPRDAAHARAPPDATHSITLQLAFTTAADGASRGTVNGVPAPSAPPPALLARPALHAAAAAAEQEVPRASAAAAGELIAIHGDGVTPFVVPFGAVVDLYINNTMDGGAHPFHLHGHSLWVLATSEQPSAAGAAGCSSRSFVRRDVVSVPALGWARVRFLADNPGAWLLHCHLTWHARAGLATAVLEAPAALAAGRPPAAHEATCSAYRQQTAASAPALPV